MTIKAREFDTVVAKFGLETRDAKDRLAWLEHEGQIVVRTKRSYTSSGEDLPYQDQIRQQLKLNEDQLREAIRCTFTRDDYIAHLKSKGVI
ncbi:MAG: hypothetical protein A2Z21_07245 [Candidatus Fraserbacteria bacterium RBG_16_55_9]|uniref:Uncharacterized protein n=1 Tax=Fraserbacteria sp. (strain RBG_16_55_9) TaxID=1817864 RepID=A0A1F5UTM7_FRAXR|nr:MAG: hypothetical protein A2Z21_07245 [Candidatus Fraserbacteria bacterium RBG_16_55_9]